MDRRPAASAAPAAALWGHAHLPFLARATSKDSVEYILQALWRTRRTGLDAVDRASLRSILHLSDDSHLDPLLVCLRILIRRCVNDDIAKEEIHALFPQELPPELQRLLTLLLQKYQAEWREDASKDQAALLFSKAIDCDLDRNQDASERSAISMKLQDDEGFSSGEVQFQLGEDSLDIMLNSMYSIREQMPNASDTDGHEAAAENT